MNCLRITVGTKEENRELISALEMLKNARKGWNLAAQELHLNQDDQLIIPDIFEDENFDE